jgi:hypothetical protein
MSGQGYLDTALSLPHLALAAAAAAAVADQRELGDERYCCATAAATLFTTDVTTRHYPALCIANFDTHHQTRAGLDLGAAIATTPSFDLTAFSTNADLTAARTGPGLSLRSVSWVISTGDCDWIHHHDS